MAAIHEQPANINFLSPLGFRFKLKRAPNLNFFITDVTLPSISLNSIELPTPFKSISISGNKLEYGDFALSFKLDEDMSTYFEIYDWLIAIGFPENFGQYEGLKNAERGTPNQLLSDATLTILTSDMVPNVEVTFEDLFPTSISNVDFTVSDNDVNYLNATVTFKYKIFHIKKV
ncbi:MAG: Synechococcus phage [Bacteroidota bacterium]|jgi:hypothetical protein